VLVTTVVEEDVEATYPLLDNRFLCFSQRPLSQRRKEVARPAKTSKKAYGAYGAGWRRGGGRRAVERRAQPLENSYVALKKEGGKRIRGC
jgi:hypothetical protein